MYLGIAWFLLPPEAIWSPDEGARLLQIQSLRLHHGHLAYDIPYNGRELDPNLQFAEPDPSRRLLRIHEGALYIRRLPLFPMIVFPLLRSFGLHGLYLLPALGGAAASALTLQLLAQNDRRLLMWVLAAFGSPVLIYSTIFWEHMLATSLGLAGAWLALGIGSTEHADPHRRVSRWVAVGTILGMSVYVRMETILFALSLLSACWLRARKDRRGPICAAVVLGLMLAPFVPLHWLMFGQALPDNAVHILSPLDYIRGAGWRAVPDLLVGPAEEEALDAGQLGELWALAAVLAIVHSLGPTDSKAARNLRTVGLGVTSIIGTLLLFRGTFYRSAHGLLFTTPWALLGLCRAREVWQRGDWRAQIIVLTTVLGLAGYTVGMIGLRGSTPQGGLEWGARFAMTFYPPLALLAGWDLGSTRRDAKYLMIISALTLLGLGFQARGIWTIRHDKQVNGALNRAIAETPECHIVSDLWWLPFNIAPIQTQKALFLAPTPEKVAQWVKVADSHNVRRFSLVTLDYGLLDNAARDLEDHRLHVVDVDYVENLLVFRVAIESSGHEAIVQH